LEQRKATVVEFVDQKYFLIKTCRFAGISRTCIYFKRKFSKASPPGRSPPGYTINRDGVAILDQTIITHLKTYRSSIEFANGGGARKLSKYLAIEQRIYINHKKIYRLCDENNLLLFRQEGKKKRKFKKTRCEYFEVKSPNQLWQFDLKYIWIHGENRWCFFLGFIDVVSKKITGWYVGKTCKAGDLVYTLNQAIKNEEITEDQPLVIRSDNGPQMSSNRFHFYLKSLERKLTHEFIPPRTPDRNAFIEAFNSILEIEVLQVRYFRNFQEVYSAILSFVEFYNTRRLHGSIGYLSPKMFIDGIKNGTITPRVVAV
jgi:putative transposase